MSFDDEYDFASANYIEIIDEAVLQSSRLAMSSQDSDRGMTVEQLPTSTSSISPVVVSTGSAVALASVMHTNYITTCRFSVSKYQSIVATTGIVPL